MFILFFVCFFHLTSSAQTDVSADLFKPTSSTAPVSRKLLQINKKNYAKPLLPFLYTGAGLLYFYQNILSPQISAGCTYEVSCSEYTKRSIEKYGIVRGSLIGLSQLQSCFPDNHQFHSSFLVTTDFKIQRLND